MNTWMIQTDSEVNSNEIKVSQAITGGRKRVLVSSVILAMLTLILFLTSVISPSPIGYAAAFPGQNGKFVVTIDPSGSWDLDTWEIYVMDPTGENLERLTDNEEFDFYPAWSPNGKKIAFSRRSQDGNYDIYVMNADGTNQRNLTNTPTVDEVIPAWSPDGKKLAVNSYPNGNFDFYASDYNGMEIYVMDANGRNPQRLTDNKFEDYGPTWSPDGQKIAFSTNRDGNYEIYVMDADGKNQTNLTNNKGKDDGYFAPYWSPDGRKIAFNSYRNNNWEIYVIDADGHNLQRLTDNKVNDSIPVWSADGQKIAFKSNRDDGNWEIYVMDVDGSNQTRLTNTELQVRILDWQSLGNKKH